MEIKNVVMIGAGNVATHLGRALSASGFHVSQVYSRTEVSAMALARVLHCPYTTSSAGILPDGDLYIVSVKDSALETLLPQIAVCNPQALYVHTAGSVPMKVWEGLVARYGVLYPMQTFSKQREVDFSQVPFFVEASHDREVEVLKSLARALGSKVYEASSEQRRYLHLAAVFACNFSNHMYAVAHHLLEAHGLPFESLYPLIDETVRKIHELSPADAQTGPAQRYDRNVIDRHLQMLAEEPRLARMYEDISQNIHEYTLATNPKTQK